MDKQGRLDNKSVKKNRLFVCGDEKKHCRVLALCSADLLDFSRLEAPTVTTKYNQDMSIWDLPTERLCRHRLLGHRELHTIWSILTNNKTGIPVTLRSSNGGGRLKALYLRHQILVTEMGNRGYRHSSPLLKKLATGKAKQDLQVDLYEDRIRDLKGKECGCKV